MSEQKRRTPSAKRIAVWLLGVVIFLLGGFWIGAAADTAASASAPEFVWVYYGTAAVLLGLGVMLYSRFVLK